MGHLYHSYVANYHGGLSSQTETETEGVYTRSKWEFNSMVLVVLEKQKANTWTIQQQSSKCRYIRYGMVDFRPTNETQRYHWSRTPQSSPYLQALRENGSSHFSTKKWQYIKTSGFPHGIFVFFHLSGCFLSQNRRDFWLFISIPSKGPAAEHLELPPGRLRCSARPSQRPAWEIVSKRWREEVWLTKMNPWHLLEEFWELSFPNICLIKTLNHHHQTWGFTWFVNSVHNLKSQVQGRYPLKMG